MRHESCRKMQKRRKCESVSYGLHTNSNNSMRRHAQAAGADQIPTYEICVRVHVLFLRYFYFISFSTKPTTQSLFAEHPARRRVPKNPPDIVYVSVHLTENARLFPAERYDRLNSKDYLEPTA